MEWGEEGGDCGDWGGSLRGGQGKRGMGKEGVGKERGREFFWDYGLGVI